MKPFEDCSIEGANDPAPSLPTRRRFLALISTGTAAALAGCSSASSEPQMFGDVAAGAVADLPVGALKNIVGAPAIIGRDDLGVYAMTSTCTHQGCTVGEAGAGASIFLRCPCHGSEFDRNGGVTNGPASSPLVHFQVDIAASGQITVRGGMQVAASTRVPVA
jgi:nitrite reductase/ring-hydroxylating ferredoxin subunit